jgi:WD40 repeat protein
MRVPVSGGGSDVVLELPFSLGSDLHCPRQPGSFCVLSERKDNDLTFYQFDPLQGKRNEVARTQIRRDHYYGWGISPDGSHLAVVSAVGPYVRTIDLKAGKIRDIDVPKDWLLQDVGWSGDGKAVFVTVWTPKGFVLGRVELAGNARVLLQKENQWMNQVVASPDGRYLAFTAQTWDNNVWLLENF